MLRISSTDQSTARKAKNLQETGTRTVDATQNKQNRIQLHSATVTATKQFQTKQFQTKQIQTKTKEIFLNSTKTSKQTRRD